jgi:hypothetical protein
MDGEGTTTPGELEIRVARGPAACACFLAAWLQAYSRLLPGNLALDCKNIGEGICGMIITLCRREAVFNALHAPFSP